MQETNLNLLHTTNHYFKKIMKKTLFIGLFLALLAPAVAQENTVSLKTTGSAETKEKAVQYALRSAIEQAFGAFISSNTEILNDELVADEITSVASGNIEKYDILSETVNEEGNSWFVTVNVKVSVGKLTEFVQAKGVEVEIKGGLFAINIKQKQLNSDGEYKAILDMLKPFHEAMLNAYNYQLEVGQPVAKDQTNKDWEVALTVTADSNKNLLSAFSILKNTISSLSLTSEELEEYNKLNKEVFPVFISFAFDRDAYRQEEIELGSEVFEKGTLLIDIAKDYGVSVNQLMSFNPYWTVYFRGKGDKEKLWMDRPKKFFANPNDGPEPIYFLRNRKSYEVLRFVVSKYLKRLYGSTYNITSDAHNYYSFPKTEVTLDQSLIEKQGHALKITGQVNTISAGKQTDENYSIGTGLAFEKTTFTGLENYKNFYRVVLPTESLNRINEEVNATRDPPNLDSYKWKWGNNYVDIAFYPNKQFQFKDQLTLEEVENLNGYKVEPNRNVFSFSNGGITIKNGNKKIVIPVDPILPSWEAKMREGVDNLNSANSICKSFKYGGYSDWKISSADNIYQILNQYPISHFRKHENRYNPASSVFLASDGAAWSKYNFGEAAGRGCYCFCTRILKP